MFTGSQKERDIVKKVFKYSERRMYPVYDIPEPDVDFILETPNVKIGEDFQVKVWLLFLGHHYWF